MKRYILLLLINCIILNAYNQVDIKLQKCLGGNSYDYPGSLESTMEGGYVLGATVSLEYWEPMGGGYSKTSQFDYWIIKLNSNGDTLWTKYYGNTKTDRDCKVKQTSDSGYLAAGTIPGISYANSPDIWILKLDKNGKTVWTKTLGGSNYESLEDIQQTYDGGYLILAGTESNDGDVSGNHGSSDYWLVKLDDSGKVLWKKCYGGSTWDKPNCMLQTLDKGILISGSTISYDGDVPATAKFLDNWLLKLDSTGKIIWSRTYNTGNTTFNYGRCIHQTNDSCIVIGGDTYDWSYNGIDYNGWIYKIDSVGNFKWQQIFGGSGSDYIRSFRQTNDSGYVCLLYTNSTDGIVYGNHGDIDNMVLKLNKYGHVEWARCLGGGGSEYPISIVQTTDNDYLFTCETNSLDGDVKGNHGSSDIWLVKFNVSNIAPLVTPSLITSFNKDTIKAGDTIKWSQSLDAENYYLQFSNDSDFSHIDKDTVVENYNSCVTNILDYNQNYYWRVKAANALDTTEWSNVGKFITRPAPPPPPLLISPASNGTNLPLSLNLQWMDTSYEANNYILIVSKNYYFNDTVLFYTNVITTEQMITNLEYNRKYYWRVKALNINGESKWSETNSFTTTNLIEDNILNSFSNPGVYPNPVHNILHINDPQNIIKHISICSPDGKYLLNFNSIIDNQIDLTGLRPGLYFIRMSNLQRTFINAVIKE